MLKEIARKLKLTKIWYRIKRKKLFGNKPLTLSENEALATLEAFSPDPKQSCIAPKKLGTEYNLEIIIPAYNVESYIEKCMKSVLSQKTAFTYHITCVDDGSTDKTGELLDSYSTQPNVTVIHQKNKGFSGARNTGIELSNGKYIMFVDSDDTIPQNTIQTLLSLAFSNNADVVEGGHILTIHNGIPYREMKHKKGHIEKRSQMAGYPWGKVIRKKFFEMISFPLQYLYEDSIMSQIIYPLSSILYGTDTPVYCYRRNPKGISRGGSLKKNTIDSFWITRQLYEDRKKLGIENNQEYYEYILSMAKLTYGRTAKMPEEIKKAVFIAFASFIDKEFNGYETNTKQDLEYALKHRNYELYEAYCQA